MELLFELEYEENSDLGKDPEQDLEFLLLVAKKNIKNPDLEMIKRGFWFCYQKHKGVARKSGTPYYTHPLNVAIILLNEIPDSDTQSVVSCLLHDTIEDVKGVKHNTIEAEFNKEIADLVDGVTKISHAEMSKTENKAATYRKLFLALVIDVRIILIKLADRLHNMRTLHYLPPAKQRDIAQETLNFYTPIAHRLGLTKVKMELENRSFYFSDRSTYEAIRSALNLKRRDFIDYIRVFTDHIQNSLNNHGIDHTMTIIHKHEYEIYKMIQDGKAISDIDNFYSIVIILDTDDISECYRAHGILANAFNTISFVDYIANSKIDWYKSLNTVLFGPDGKRVEILIRTREMEKIAEEGFAAQFSLERGSKRALQFKNEDIAYWGEWMQSIIEERGEEASQIIWDSIKVNLFDSELVTYTKDGSAVKLPEGANIIDFAFALSSDLGFHTISAKVNGVLKELNYLLQSGDQVEIISSPNASPKKEWQNFVVSHRAVSQLHRYFQQRPKEDEKKKEKVNFEARLRIRGDDRNGMLKDISSAIGLANIHRVNLDTTGTMFEGAISIHVQNNKELNLIFAKLLTIKGIKSVVRIDGNKP